jgi:signal transduction histidine kinase
MDPAEQAMDAGDRESTVPGDAPDEAARVLAGGGEAGALARSVDWSSTAIGPVEGWSPALRAAAALVLHNHSGMLLWWGPDFVQIYNDAYRPVLGDKHPRAMGQPFRECWAEVFHILGPMAERPFRGGPASTSDDLALLIHRKVHREETHFRLAYSPVPDDTVKPTGVGGVLATVTEITEQAYAERQLRTLRELGAGGAGEGSSAEQACAAAAATLRRNPWDVPFALFFLLDDDGRRARLAANSGFGLLPSDYPGAHELDVAASAVEPGADVVDPWRIDRALTENQIQIIDDLSACPFALPCSPWADRPRSAIVLPLSSPDQPHPYGFLVCGISPHRMLDTGYRTFFELAAARVVTAIRDARALEQERKRAEALAEIDRAKTAFFSNISHEFRTPLTLMLGPLQDALQSPDRAIAGETLSSVHRNTVRLLKLVNSLLEFSRIEAGRVDMSYQPTDLAITTQELVSAFRSAVEGGGLELQVECAPLLEPVYVDRDMWERIVLNLLSNAFKFTFEGSIRVTQQLVGAEVVLEVRDTGVGIPADALPRLFERFYRIEGTPARTHEGSGIGLALVRDMVALHGGRVDVASEVGQGTTFTVSLPLGHAHLPAERVRSVPARSAACGRSDAFVAEAMSWLPDEMETEPAAASGGATTAAPPSTRMPGRVLVVDDNADMRSYLARLLRQSWTVDVATDGVDALASAKSIRPDVVVSDIMMPNLDGFGLLRAIRSDHSLASIPVILLSARAGDEMRVDGLEAGADDYLVKPFSAKELVARVRVHLENASLRQTAEVARAEAESANRAKDDFLAMLGHELRNPLSPIVTALELMRLRGAHSTEHEVIERQVGHLSRLVEDMLDVSRIVSGKVDLRRTRIELSQVVLRGLEVARPLLEQRGQIVVLHVASNGLVVDVDPDRLAQVVANLLTNAAKYSEPATTIHVSAAPDGARVRLRVRDEGIGIAPDMLDKIFGMFFQQSQSLDRSKGGLGLGLAIVRNLIELHGGSVTVTSDGPGRGSEFVVELPLAREAMCIGGAAPDGRDGATPNGAQVHCSKRILIVDDNADVAEGLSALLRSLGHDTVIAHDGGEALRVAGAFKPEICLLDIGLPTMDGYELARRLRESRDLCDGARLIAVSGYGQARYREQSLSAGFDAHLVKPIELDVLMHAVGG